MSDTPETDAALKDQAKWMRPFVSTTFDGITYDSTVAALCRKLERERDEALIDRANKDIATMTTNHYERILRERNEAIAEIQRLRLDAQREAEHHDRMVKEIEGLYDQLAKTKPSNEHICSLSKDLMGNCIICDG